MGDGFDVLVVEDQAGLRATLYEVAAEKARRVERAGSVREALEWLTEWTPSLVVLDFVLPDGTGLDVLARTVQLAPVPRVVAISGEATPEDAFRLARAGVQCFLHKPFGLEQIRAAMSEALDSIPDPLPEVRGSVGVVPIKDLEANVRRAMVSEALARSGGSVRGAATLLGVSRQTLQHILKSPDHEGKIER